MKYRFTASLKPFTGEDITIEDNSFRRVYSIVMSEARAAGCNLSGFQVVHIKDRETREIYGISNWDGYIAVGNPERAITVKCPRRY